MNDQEFRKKLNPEQYRVMREKGAEYPYSGRFWDHEELGMYYCAACEAPLFSSMNKFDSGTGFPSFHETLDAEKLQTVRMLSESGTKDEVVCKRCGSHMGFIMENPGEKGQMYYRVNSASLAFEEMPEVELPEEEEGEKEGVDAKDEEKKNGEEKKTSRKQGSSELVRTIVIICIAAGAGAAMGAQYCAMRCGDTDAIADALSGTPIVVLESPMMSENPSIVPVTPSLAPVSSPTSLPAAATSPAPSPMLSSTPSVSLPNPGSDVRPSGEPAPTKSAAPAPTPMPASSPSPEPTPEPLPTPTSTPLPVSSTPMGSDGTSDGTK